MFIIGLSLSCEKDDLLEEIEQTDIERSTNLKSSIQDRQKVENPYTIANMKKALSAINDKMELGELHFETSTTLAKISRLKIVPNVIYVKFMPETPKQESILKKERMALLDYPLGYEYSANFFENRIPLDEGEMPTYYTTISVERTLPAGVPHEILEEMYLPQEDASLNSNGKTTNLKMKEGGDVHDFVDVLLEQALQQTNNTGMDGLGITANDSGTGDQILGIGLGSKWRPEGTLRIWDSNIGTTSTTRQIFVRYEYYYCDDPSGPTWDSPGGGSGSGGNGPIRIDDDVIPVFDGNECRRAIYRYETDVENGSYQPLVGAQVLLRDTFTVGNEITDTNGNFRFREYRGKKRYIIQWERYEFSIRDGTTFQAEYRGPKRNIRWDHDIRGGEQEYFGRIHQGAFDYYYGDRFGLTSPPTNATLRRQIKIAARKENDRSSYVKARRIWFGADISLQAWGDPSDEVYGTIVHELAHAAHRELDGSAYNNVVFDAYTSPCVSFNGCNNLGPTGNNNRRLLETWATTVELLFVLRRYRDEAGNSAYKYRNNNLQFLTIETENHYTSAGLDMIDDINQRALFGVARPLDRVEGYTINQLENALIGARSWWEWRDQIRNNFNNPTEGFLNELFANWPD